MAQFFEQQPGVEGKLARQQQGQCHGGKRPKHLPEIVEGQAFFKPHAQTGYAQGQTRKRCGNGTKKTAYVLQHKNILGCCLLASLPRNWH